MNIIIGGIMVFACVLGGYAAMGGKISILWQPFEVMIILGAAIGAFVMSNALNVVRDTGRNIFALLKGPKYSRDDYLELLSMQFALFKHCKAKGVMDLEKDIEDPHNSDLFTRFPGVLNNEKGILFVTDYLRLISLGSEKSHELEALIDEELEAMHRDLGRPGRALQQTADALPALGIVAAVLGVVKAMSAINQPPEILGGLIGAAMVGTFLGVLLSYGLVGPLAAAMKHKAEEEVNFFTCIKAGLLAFLNGYAPQICVEFARKVVFEECQPTFYEVEEATTLAIQAQRARAA